MFTGIIEAIGSIRAITPKGGDVRVYVATGKLDLGDVKLGDSIAVNGVCLTAVELPGDGFWADVSRETLARTGFIDLKTGSAVTWSAGMSTASARCCPARTTHAPCNFASARRASWPGTSPSRARSPWTAPA